MNKQSQQPRTSKTTGSDPHPTQQNLIGQPHGEFGFVSPITSRAPTPDDATRAMVFWRELGGRGLKLPKDRETAGEICEFLSRPAPSEWVSGRIAGLLAHYFMQSDPDLNKMVFDDWILVLEKYPAWAIKNACIAYLAADKKRGKPTPGMIAELAAEQFSIVWTLKAEIQKFDKSPPQLPKPEQTAEQRAEIAARLTATIKFTQFEPVKARNPHDPFV